MVFLKFCGMPDNAEEFGIKIRIALLKPNKLCKIIQKNINVINYVWYNYINFLSSKKLKEIICSYFFQVTFNLNLPHLLHFWITAKMLLDDIIYMSLLFISVAIGPIIRNVPNPYYRKMSSTILGFIIVFIVSGNHIIHPLLVTFINALILLICNKK